MDSCHTSVQVSFCWHHCRSPRDRRFPRHFPSFVTTIHTPFLAAPSPNGRASQRSSISCPRPSPTTIRFTLQTRSLSLASVTAPLPVVSPLLFSVAFCTPFQAWLSSSVHWCVLFFIQCPFHIVDLAYVSHFHAIPLLLICCPVKVSIKPSSSVLCGLFMHAGHDLLRMCCLCTLSLYHVCRFHWPQKIHAITFSCRAAFPWTICCSSFIRKISHWIVLTWPEAKRGMSCICYYRYCSWHLSAPTTQRITQHGDELFQPSMLVPENKSEFPCPISPPGASPSGPEIVNVYFLLRPDLDWSACHEGELVICSWMSRLSIKELDG